jgi:hypothetical protein
VCEGGGHRSHGSEILCGQGTGNESHIRNSLLERRSTKSHVGEKLTKCVSFVKIEFPALF